MSPTLSGRGRRFAAPLVLVAAAACGTHGDLYEASLTPLPFLRTTTALVQIVPQSARAVLVDPSRDAPDALPISEGARTAAAAPIGHPVLVGVLGGTARRPVMDVIDVAAREVDTFDVPGMFDAIHFSPDGAAALLTYTAGGATGLAAKNLNEVALVDVVARASLRIQLDTESLAPRAVLFGPREPDRWLVAVALERGVAVLDAMNPSAPPRRISLRPQGATTESTVVEALFALDARYLYVRATGLDDVVAIELSRGPEGVGASINFLAGGQGLSDIALPASGDGVLASFVTSREVYRLDPTGISDLNARADLPEALGVIQPLSGTRALVYSATSRSVFAWDFADGRSGTALLDGAWQRVAFDASRDLAVFGHASTLGAAGAALSVVTVEDDVNRLRTRIRSILLRTPLAEFAVASGGGQLFFALSNANEIVSMDLASLALSQILLDERAVAVHHLADAGFVAIVHPGMGDVTVFPVGATERSQAVRYVSTALTGALDRPEDSP